MTSYGPAYQRLHGAIRELALGDGDLTERLDEAWLIVDELRLALLPDHDDFVLPPWLERELRELSAFWGHFELPQIENAVKSLRPVERAEHARNIWTWYERIREED